ncbi:MAG: ATP-binding cassette domain-containing protein [Candidatus Heteroscillospira sp.]|jgi:ABC-type multidrug transport system ATPase subunit
MNLNVHNLLVGYDGTAVLPPFSFDFTPAAGWALMGASGAGKTTLLHTLAGLLPPLSGDIGGFKDAKCALLFQEDRLLGHLSALDNVALVSSPETAAQLLGELGLGDKLGEKPGALSGGQRRRIALARCLAFGGDVLLLDEPFTGLDAGTRLTACRVIKERFSRVILSTHDPEEAELLGAGKINL